jgi:hypothetical protein
MTKRRTSAGTITGPPGAVSAAKKPMMKQPTTLIVSVPKGKPCPSH